MRRAPRSLIVGARAATLGIASVLGIVLVLQAAAVTYPIVPADRAQRPARLLDRTMSCSIPRHAGLRELQVTAVSGLRDPENRSLWRYLANFGVFAGGGSKGVGLAGATAGAPQPREFHWLGHDQGLFIGAACRLSSARLALTPRGLTQGGVASQLRDGYECVAPKTVLVRVRARFRVPTRLRVRAGSLRTGAPVGEAAVVVRTASGKPLVYASASESGKARLFTAGNCFPD